MARDVTHLEIGGIWIDCSLREQHQMSAAVTKHPVEDGADVTDHVRLDPDRLQIEGIVTNTPLEPPLSDLDGATVGNEWHQLLDHEGGPVRGGKQTGTLEVEIEGAPIAGWLSLLPLGAGDAYRVLRVANQIPKQRLKAKLARYEHVPRDVSFQGLTFSRDTDRVAFVYESLRTTFQARKIVTIVTALREYSNIILTDLQISREASNGGALFFSASAELIRIVKSQTGLAGAPQPAQVRAKPALNKGAQATTAPKPGEVSDTNKRKASALKQGLTPSPPAPEGTP